MESVSAGYGDPDVSRSAPTDPGSAGDSDDPAEIDQLRRRLRDAQKELTDVFDRSALGLAMADFDGILTRVNPAFCAILGRTPAELVGTRLRAVAASRDRKLHPRMASFVAGSSGVRDSFDALFERPDGSVGSIRVHLSFRSGLELGSGIWIQLEDASERQAAVDEMLAADQRFSLAMHNAPIGMALVALDGTFMEVNDALCRMLGYKPAVLVHKTFQEITVPEDLQRDLGYIEQLLAGEISDYQMEKRYIRADGTTTWAQLHVSLVRDGLGVPQYFVSQIVDINATKRAVEEVKQARERFRLLAESASDVVWQVGLDGNINWVSPSVTSALGYEPAEILAMHAIDVVHFEDQRHAREVLNRVLRHGESQQCQVRMRTESGEPRWMAVQARPLFSEYGELTGAAWGMRDVTDEFAAREELARSEQLFRLAMDGAPLGMAVTGLHMRFFRVNSRLCELLGRDQQWLLEHSALEIFDLHEGAEALPECDELLAGATQHLERERRLRTANGDAVWVRHSISLLRDEHGMPLYYVSQFHDITKERDATQRLAEKARRDPLTGLLNRDSGLLAIDLALDMAHDSGSLVAVLFCDLDGFKEVNDSLGHQLGDQVLCAATTLLTQTVRSGDVVARLGGDEFVVVLGGLRNADGAHRVAQKIITALDGSHHVTHSVTVPPVSVGICVSTAGFEPTDLLRAADEALYEAKRAGGGQYCIRELNANDPAE